MTKCLESCRGGGCLGVSVVPVKNPPTVAPWLQDVELLPFHFNNSNCQRDWFKGKDHNTYVCTGLVPRDATDTQEPYAITRDPLNPYFYSTCYLKEPVFVFANEPPAPTQKPAGWRFGEQCTTCEVTAARSYIDGGLSSWPLADDVCVNCDAEPAVVPPPKREAPWTEVAKQRSCDGLYFTFQEGIRHAYQVASNAPRDCAAGHECFHRLVPAGGRASGSIGPTRIDCAELAARHTDCDRQHIMFAGDQCWCMSKAPCCGQCQLMSGSTHFHTYRLDEPFPFKI